MRKIISATLLAVALIYGCIQGAQWQYDRFQLRHASNELIRNNISLPAISERQLQQSDQSKIAWREARLSGSFIPEKQLLIRNRYHDGKYGFGVVTLFKSDLGKIYWVDRGWVAAGENAQTPPVTQAVTTENLTIVARVRIENLENQLRGSVFAVPGSQSNQLEKWSSQESVETEQIYLDLISASNAKFNPAVPATLPEISDGPHLAYSFQWLIFAGLVVLAWFLVIREERRYQTEKL